MVDGGSRRQAPLADSERQEDGVTGKDPTVDSRAGTTSPWLVVTAGTGLLCLAAAAALVRWSRWWPHSDMWQIWANGLTVLSSVFGLVTLLIAFRRLDGRARWLLVGLAVVAAAVGLLGGFGLLRSATADMR